MITVHLVWVISLFTILIDRGSSQGQSIYSNSSYVSSNPDRVDNEPFFLDDTNDRIRYLLFAPRLIRPDTVLRVFIHLLRSTHPIRVQASLRTVSAASGTVSVDPLQESDAGMLFDRSVTLLEWPTVGRLLIPLPVHLQPARYSLLLLGDPPDRSGGSLFRHVIPLEYSERFLTILIQTNQLVYNVRQVIRVRIVLLDLRQLPWDEPVDVWLLDSRGIIMKRWVSIYPFQGDLCFTLRQHC
jgi:hypothetical protein